jgi:hypothetical protein
LWLAEDGKTYIQRVGIRFGPEVEVEFAPLPHYKLAVWPFNEASSCLVGSAFHSPALLLPCSCGVAVWF